MNPLNQTVKHDSRTDKYNFISTENVLNYFSDKGWNIGKDSAGSELITYSKSKANSGFQSHLIRLRNNDFNINDYHIPEIVIINSHDGSKALRLALGVFRFVCENGLISGNCLDQYKISHKGFTYEKLEQALNSLLGQVDSLNHNIERLSKTHLTDNERELLAKKVMNERLLEVSNVTDINLNSVMSELRNEDCGVDAWTYLNVLQEKLIRGGVDYLQVKDVKDDNGKVVDNRTITRTTRPIRNIDSVIHYNQYVWNEVAALTNKGHLAQLAA